LGDKESGRELLERKIHIIAKIMGFI